MGISQHKDLKFDNEYSRLIGAIGKDALKRLQAAKVLLVGLNGLGLEIGAFRLPSPLVYALPLPSQVLIPSSRDDCACLLSE